MPQCKNDTNRYYKGDEPSPKGLGYCAHAERKGKVRKGKDRNEWIVAVDNQGRKSWKKRPEETTTSKKRARERSPSSTRKKAKSSSKSPFNKKQSSTRKKKEKAKDLERSKKTKQKQKKTTRSKEQQSTGNDVARLIIRNRKRGTGKQKEQQQNLPDTVDLTLLDLIRDTKRKRTTRSGKARYRIIFTEPITYDPQDKNSNRILANAFEIDKDMRDSILKGPVLSPTCDDPDPRNAYVFGNLFPLKEYVWLSNHGNDVAQTGFIDVDESIKVPSTVWQNTRLWEIAFPESDTRYWDRSEGLKEIQKKNPSILWVGQSNGGDVGMDLYIHRDKKNGNRIDGLIVDNFYYFSDTEGNSLTTFPRLSAPYPYGPGCPAQFDSRTLGTPENMQPIGNFRFGPAKLQVKTDTLPNLFENDEDAKRVAAYRNELQKKEPPPKTTLSTYGRIHTGTVYPGGYMMPITTTTVAPNDRRKVIKFYNRSDPYFEFTNFYERPINIDDRYWPTVEHYFQAQKFINYPNVVQDIRNQPTARQAFQFSRMTHYPVRADWDNIKDSVMRKAVLAKFTQNDDLAEMLIKTGDAELVEHTENDRYWGDGGDGMGLNKFGKILMEVRTELQQKRNRYGIPSHSIPVSTTAPYGGLPTIWGYSL